MIKVTDKEAKDILAIATRPIKGGLPFDINDALGERITTIQEAIDKLEPQDKLVDENGQDITPAVDMEIEIEPFPKSILRKAKINFGQEWSTGAMRKMFFEDEQ